MVGVEKIEICRAYSTSSGETRGEGSINLSSELLRLRLCPEALGETLASSDPLRLRLPVDFLLGDVDSGSACTSSASAVHCGKIAGNYHEINNVNIEHFLT